MSDDEMRVAIAEKCGWKGPQHFDTQEIIKDWPYSRGKSLWVIGPTGGITSVHNLPDYLTDLNACHEMEKVLTGTQGYSYRDMLRSLAVKHQALEPMSGSSGMDYHATARQRAEAFCRTLWPNASTTE